MPVSSSRAFSPVSLSKHEAKTLENMMKKQVQDAILARSVQAAKNDNLNSDWRFAGSVGQLKTFKLRGADPFSSTSSWATTIEKTTRATAYNLNERATTGFSSRRGIRTRQEMQTVSRQTVGSIFGRRDRLDPHPPLESFRCFGHVQGNYRDIVGVHHAVNSADFAQQQKLLNPSVIDGAVLRSIRASKDSYLGIKWLVENSFSGKHDICFVEMVGYTTDNNDQEVGFVAVASVDVPECPELSGSPKLKRVRMKRTMLVIPTQDPKVSSEVFVMGGSEANESLIIAHAQQQLSMAVLNDISLAIDSQNLIRRTLIRRVDWVPDESRPSCTICSRRFRFVARRRHHCRMCGDLICKTCYVNRSAPCTDTACSGDGGPAHPATIRQTKFCVRCVMELRAVDKRLVNRLAQVSKVLSLSFDITDMSPTAGTFEEFVELDSPESNPRASSFFNFSESANSMSAPKHKSSERGWDATATYTNAYANAPVGGYEFHRSYGSSKYLRATLSNDSLNSLSFSQVRRLSLLSRRSSAASVSSQPNPFEEKM